jgi:hypothetical protein
MIRDEMNIYWNLETSFSRFSWITFSEVGNGNISIRLRQKERKKQTIRNKNKKKRETKKIFFMICHVNTGNEIKKKNLVIIIEISCYIALIESFFYFSFCLYFSHYHLFTFNSFSYLCLDFSLYFPCLRMFDPTVKLNFLITQDFGNERNKYYYCNGIETNGLLVCRCYVLNDTFLLISSINISSKVLLLELLIYVFNIFLIQSIFGGKKHYVIFKAWFQSNKCNLGS